MCTSVICMCHQVLYCSCSYITAEKTDVSKEQTDKQTDRPTDRHKHSVNRYCIVFAATTWGRNGYYIHRIDKQTDRLTERRTNRHILVWWPEPCILSLHSVGCIGRARVNALGKPIWFCVQNYRESSAALCVLKESCLFTVKATISQWRTYCLEVQIFVCEKMCIINWYRPFHFRILLFVQCIFRNIVFLFYWSKF